MVRKILTILVILAGSVDVSAGVIGRATRDRLIQKFRTVYLQLAPSDASRTPITLRLADLLAERARLSSLAELDGNCGACDAGVKDRREALKYYSESIAKTAAKKRGKILSQMGHLYELIGEPHRAKKLYKDILDKKVGGVSEAEALISLAEMAFKSSQFSEAIKYYTLSINHQDLKKKGFASYRRAWSYFNSGEIEKATAGLINILRTPALLSRNGNGGVVENSQFKEEVSRDLATFLARGDVTVKDAELLYEVSSENSRIENVAYLASELERLGQLKSSAQLWNFVQARESSPVRRLDGHLHLAQIYWNLKDRVGAKRDYFKALDLWQSIGTCKGDQCKERKSRLRAFVLQWHKVSKKNPSQLLFEVYEYYVSVFKNDSVLRINLARLYRQKSNWKLAYAIYSDIISRYGELAEKVRKVLPEREALLGSLVEVAEASIDKILITQAYNVYLSESIKREKELEVRYQQAYMSYKAEEYKVSADRFREIALSKVYKGKSILKGQAADLALDVLVILKDDIKLEEWTREFVSIFPEKKKEYNKIVRTSLMNQMARDVGDGLLQAAWGKLLKVNLGDTTLEEKKLYLSNRYILAEKLGKYSEARTTIFKYLKLKKLSNKEREEALIKQAWYAELKLDFKEALKVSKRLPMVGIKPSQKWLKLALFAELAGESYGPYYQKFLKVQHDSEKEKVVLAKWITESKEPVKTIFKLKRYLKKFPKLYASLLLEEYMKNPRADVRKLLLTDRVLAKTAASKMIWGLEFLTNYQKRQGKLASMTIDSSSQKKLARSIRARVKQLFKMEEELKRAMKRDHWGAQLVVIDLLATENERFYQELLSLPMPDGLTADEQQQYLQILSQQAAPHLEVANAMKSKRNEMLADSKVVPAYIADISAASVAVRAGMAKELAVISPLLTVEANDKITSAMKVQEPVKVFPTLAKLEQARAAVREKPLSLVALDDLMVVEKEMGRESMVSYLKGRRVFIEERAQQTIGKEEASGDKQVD